MPNFLVAGAAPKKKTPAAKQKKTSAAKQKKPTKKTPAKKNVPVAKRHIRVFQRGGDDCGGPQSIEPVTGVRFSVGNVLPNYAPAPSLALLKSPIACSDGALMGARVDNIVFPGNDPAAAQNLVSAGDFNLPVPITLPLTGGGSKKKKTPVAAKKKKTATKKKTVVLTKKKTVAPKKKVVARKC